MNRDGLNELFEYTTFTWETYARAIPELPAGELTRPIEDSGWVSLLEPFVHLACPWDRWLSVHAGDEPFEFEVAKISTWDGVQSARRRTRGWIRRILDGADADLFQKAESPFADQPDAMPVTAADLILHILLHERGHHGDISTLLSQAGVPFAGNDFIVYLFIRHAAKRTL